MQFSLLINFSPDEMEILPGKLEMVVGGNKLCN